MGKTNYTKVDSMLENNLRRMTVEHDLKSAEQLSKHNPGTTPAEGVTPSDSPAGSAVDLAQNRLIAALQRDLKKLQLADHKTMYDTLALKKNEIRKKIEHPEKLTPEEWETLKQIKEKIDQYRSELKAKLPAASNDAIVEAERHKHINKRFNVNEKWLPLH